MKFTDTNKLTRRALRFGASWGTIGLANYQREPAPHKIAKPRERRDRKVKP